MRNIIFKHTLIWLVLSVGYFFAAEPIDKLLFRGFDNVDIWLSTLIGGLVIILLIMTIALTLNIVRHKRRLKTRS